LSGTTRLDTRRQKRVPLDATVKVRWSGAIGESHFARGKILNCSDMGLCFELIEPIKPLSYVSLNAPELNGADWAAGGSVRYCTPKGYKYLVGVELRSGAKWD